MKLLLALISYFVFEFNIGLLGCFIIQIQIHVLSNVLDTFFKHENVLNSFIKKFPSYKKLLASDKKLNAVLKSALAVLFVNKWQ
jgi:hypothetical protein